MTCPRLLKNGFEDIFRAGSFKKRKTMKTTEGDEML